MEMADLAGMPNDDAILAEIREILKTADLMTVTKKGIKLELEKRFGINLEPRKPYIGSGKFFFSFFSFFFMILFKSRGPKAKHFDFITATEAILSGQL